MANNDFLNQFTNDNYKKQPEKQGKPVPKVETTPVAKPITTPKKETVVVKQEVKKEVPVNDNKLESFREEKRTKVEKAPINPLLIIIPSIVALIIVVILIYIFLFPHIQVQNFVGQTKNDVSAWIKQQGIETSGIILKEEYDFNAPEGTILSQLPETGKVKKDAKMTFVVSKGANPDEYVSVPDLESMNKQEIETWIKENKLSNTKITTAYDNEVENGNVVSVVYGNGIDSSNFTRGSSLKITISKGQKPADQVTVENFVKQPYSSVEAWADKNKIKLTKTEVYSDTINAGEVISQSIEANKKLNQGDSFSVVVSKGKGILVPTFSSMTSSQIDKWIEENSLYIKTTGKYSNSDDYVLEQSIKSGNYIGTDKTIELTLNLGNGFYLDEVYPSYGSGSYDKFKEWADNKSSELGLYVDTHRVVVESAVSKGTILGIQSIKNGSTTYSEIEKLPLSVDIYVYVSNGSANEEPEKTTFTLDSSAELSNKTYSEIVAWCEEKGAAVSGIKMIAGGDESPISDTSDNTKYDVDYFYSKDAYGNNVEYRKGSSSVEVPKGATLILKIH